MFDDLKFFTKDIITGDMDEVGSTFTAVWFGGEATFVVNEVCGNGMVFAEKVKD